MTLHHGIPHHTKCHTYTLQPLIAVMVRHDTLSRRPPKEQPSTDIHDDKTTTTTVDHNHIPLPSLTHSILCPPSDRCDTGGVPYLHREGRPLTSAGSIPSWFVGPSYSFSHVRLRYCVGIDICVSECNISCLPFLMILSRGRFVDLLVSS